MALGKVMIIANKTDAFVCQVIHTLRLREMEYTLCDNVYTATGWLSKIKHDPVLVIASVYHLISEGERFLTLLMRLEGVCCCVFDGSMSCRLSTVVQMATRHGVFWAYTPKDVQIMIDRWCRSRQDRTLYHSHPGLCKDCITTEEELNALLGGYADD
jgi:hypothetical protein